MADEIWWLYLIECRGGGIYTGIAKDVEARYRKHESGKGAAYTKMNPPVRLLGKLAYPDHRSAAQAEVAMKRLKPLEKRQWAMVMGEFTSPPLADNRSQRCSA